MPPHETHRYYVPIDYHKSPLLQDENDIFEKISQADNKFLFLQPPSEWEGSFYSIAYKRILTARRKALSWV